MSDQVRKPRGNTARVALGTLTAIPAGADWDPETARRALAWYPAVGWLIGLLAAAVPFVAGALGWRGKSAAMVGVLILLVIAGASKAMHYDALADTADGLLGGDSPESKLDIMDDSAVGAFGVTIVAFSIAAQSAALTGIVQTTAWYAIVVGCVVARFSAAAALWTLPAARKDGLVAPLAGRPRAGTVALALVWLLALGALGFVVVGENFSSVGLSAVPFSGWPAHQVRGFITCTVGALAAGLVLPALFARQVKGLTGDIVGATIILTTTFTFAVAALLG
jgi:adenosylcobinamide-GDP ribazoletransferase